MNTVPAPISTTDLTMVAGEPRILDIRVGERLGYSRPRDVRNIVEQNRAELEQYGKLVCANTPQTSKGGRPATEYWLNEGQTLLLCMFSRTERAADVRQEVIGVYMAHRRGQLAPVPSDPWERMANRQDVIRRTVAFHIETKSPDFRDNLAYLLGDGKRSHRLPPWWGDVEVRDALVSLHRQAGLDAVRGVLLDRFGPLRTPSRSAIGRFWQDLDRARGGR